MFQKLIKFSIDSKLVVGVVTLTLIIWGSYSLSQLPFDSTPDITNNQVQVITLSPSLGAQEVEQLITTPIEMSLANIPQVIERRSISRSGLSVITLVFEDNADIYWARQQVSQQLKEAEEVVSSKLGTIGMGPISTGLGEIYHYTIRAQKGYEDSYSLTELRTVQDWIVRKQLSGTEGIAEVSGWGGFVKQYEVAVNSDKLNAAGVSIPEIFAALEGNNENTGGSYIEQYSNQYFIRGIGLVCSLEDVEQIAVKTVDGTPILIRDVAKVQLGSATRYGAVTRNGEGEVVAGITLMLKGENFQQVIKNVKERLVQVQKSLPEGVVIEPFIDRTQLVGRVTNTVAKNLLEGGLIVVFILVLFLGNLRAGLVVASVIPLSMLFAFGMMRVFGVSGNLMSLGAIDFGLIVDGAVIIVEAVCHHLYTSKNRSSGALLSQKEMDVEVYNSASKIRNSAAFGEIIIMIVYIPLFTLAGIEGKMFRPMAMTVFFAILGAFILSLTYVPMASALFLSKKTEQKRSISDRIMDRLRSWYRPLISASLNWSKTVVASMAIVFAFTLFVFNRMGGEFIPNLEEGDFAAEVSMMQGTSLTQMVKTTTQAEKILREQFPEVRQVVTRIGSAEIPTDPMPIERADMMIALVPKKGWTSAKTKEDLMEKMEAALSLIPGMEVEMTQPIQMRTNELITGIKQDVAVKIYGNDLDVLTASADKVAALIAKVEGVTEPFVEKVTGLPQIQVVYNRDRLAKYGISVRDANSVLETAFAGKEAGFVFEEDRRFGLVLRMEGGLRNDIHSLENLYLPLPHSNVSIPLLQLAEITYRDAPAQVTHENGQRRIYVGFNVRNRDVQSTVLEIQNILDAELKLPAGYYYAYGGQFQNLKEAKNRLLVAVPLALLLILFLLYATLKSLKESLFVFTAIPLSAIGGVWALWLRDMPFSISAGVGFIALFGVAVLNGIVLIGQFNQLEKEGVANIRERIVGGCMLRLRPVLMTALVASFGFLPMALSTSDGAEVQRPLATVVIGGLLTATLLTMLVLPSIYMIFTKNKPKMKKNLCLAVLAILLVFPSVTSAQGTVKSLPECLLHALEGNLTVQSGKISIERAKAQQGTALNIDKTTLSLSQDPTAGGSPDNSWSASQSFDFPTVYTSRHALLKAETKLEQSKLEVTRNELVMHISSTYYLLLHKRENIRILQKQDSIYEKFVLMATVKFKSGETNRLEQMNAERLYGENRMLLQKAEKDYQNIQLALQQWMNTDELIVPAEARLPTIEADSFLLGDFNPTQTPASQVLESKMAVGEKALSVAKQEFLPSFSFALKNQLLISGFNPYKLPRERFADGNFMGFEVGIGIPLFFGEQKAKAKAAKHEVDMLKIQQQDALFALGKEYQVALNEYAKAKNVLGYYRTQGNAQANEISRLSQLLYEKGEIGYVEYIQSLETALEMNLHHTDAINNFNQSVIALQFLQGNTNSSTK
jgi:cobalt-zinc-cadmium resistance protein CzcA